MRLRKTLQRFAQFNIKIILHFTVLQIYINFVIESLCYVRSKVIKIESIFSMCHSFLSMDINTFTISSDLKYNG